MRWKTELELRKPLMNAAGMLGFAPDMRAAVPWDELGAFVTNPISLRPRTATQAPAVIEYPGFLLHTGLPNPGLKRSCVSRKTLAEAPNKWWCT
jgi:dihydroorotate dehydrogenase